MDITLTDVIDAKLMQKLQDAFAKATGMAALTTDMEGPITTLSCPTDFCMKYTRTSKIGAERCNKCDLQGGEAAARTGKPSVYYCHGGLMDFAAPVIVNGKHIGSLIGGQVLPEPPDENKFRKIAREIGVNEEEYIRALRKVAVVPKERIEGAAMLLYEMANALSSVGLDKVSITNKHLEVRQTAEELTHRSENLNDAISEMDKYLAGLENEFKQLKHSAEKSAANVENTDKIARFIHSISTQITLLGFNANIESKRAGSHGAAFNVIAQEMVRLADTSTKQAALIADELINIKKSIEQIQQGLDITSETMSKNVTSVHNLEQVLSQISSLIAKL